MSKPVLDISSTPPGLAFAVHNARLERVEEGLAPMKLTLDPGLYMVREAAQTQPHLFELRDGHRYKLELGSSGNGFYEDTRSRASRVKDLVSWSKSAAEAPAPTERSFPETWLRFRRLASWSESEIVEPNVVRSSLDGDAVWVDLEMNVRAVVFAQVLVAGHRPVNTALPGNGKSRLKITFEHGRLRTEAHLADVTVNTAAQYLRHGHFLEAKQVLRTLEPPPDSPWYARFGHVLVSRFRDPVASAMGRYALLRTGEVSWLKELPSLILNSFDWLADGRVISAEIAARDGHTETALISLVHIPEGQLPLFTDGYSMLLSRLIEFIRNSDGAPAETTKEPDLDGKKADARRRREENIKAARELLLALHKWSACLDMSALTLTFRALDITKPLERDESLSPDSTWTKLPLATVWVAPAARGASTRQSRQRRR